MADAEPQPVTSATCSDIAGCCSAMLLILDATVLSLSSLYVWMQLEAAEEAAAAEGQAEWCSAQFFVDEESRTSIRPRAL